MPNGEHEDEIAYLQGEFTSAYKERIGKFDEAQCLWCVVTSDGYIAISNPYWLTALGRSKGELHYKSLFGLFHPDEAKQILDRVSKLPFEDIDEEPLHLRHKDGSHRLFLVWLQKWQEKSSGAKVTYMIGIPSGG